MLLLCAVMLVSMVCMSSCGKDNDEKETDDSTSENTAEVQGIETVAPIDTSDIEPAQGGDIVGTWKSDAMSMEIGDGVLANYNVTFIFNEDGTCSFTTSMSADEEYVDATYSVDGGNITFGGDVLVIPNATYTVDGNILLINSDTMNAAFRRQ